MSKLGDKDFEKYIDELKEANDSITWWTNRFNAVERDNKNLKQKIDKAIEYINNLKTYPFLEKYHVLDLLEILGDKE